MTTPDEELLGALGAVVRGRAHDPEQQLLERLVRSDLSAAEIKRLRQRAATDPQLDSAVALYTPLSAAAQARITGALLQAQASAKPGVAPARERMAALLPRQARKPMWLALACAAAGLLFVAWPRHGSLPTYDLEAHTSDVRYRGGALTQTSESVLALTPGTQVKLLLRPATPTAERAGVRALLAYRDESGAEHVLAWPGEATLSEQGAVSLQLKAAPVELRGLQHARLVVVLATAAQLDALSNPATGLGPTHTPHGQRWSIVLSSGR